MHQFDVVVVFVVALLQAFPDNAAKREVESLEAVCINEGCSWKGTIKEYEVFRFNARLMRIFNTQGILHVLPLSE